ncbi:MAG: hypothetical protein ACO1SV_15475 [Fimbriimonas sp.]
MTPFLFLLAFVVGLVIGYVIVQRKPKAHRYLAAAEYWVFLPGETMPTQEDVMTRMIAQNPYSRRGQSPIGAAEGLVFSDVRLHIALVLRRKNTQAFRPDLFEPHTEATAEALDALAHAQSFVKLRFISEEPLKGRQHLQFLLHAADAYADLGGGLIVYDHTCERLISRAELATTLRENFDVTLPALHTRVVWTLEGGTGHAETRGLKKIGHPDLKTLPVEPDQRILIGSVMEAAIERLWGEPTLPERVEVDAFDDHFRILIEPGREPQALARILRVQAA